MRNTLKTKITTLRLTMNLSQTAFAKLLGLSQSQICLWELGQQAPTNKVLRKLVDLAKEHSIEITIDDILSTKRRQGKNKRKTIKKRIQKQNEETKNELPSDTI